MVPEAFSCFQAQLKRAEGPETVVDTGPGRA
jgi:hypothetical protein